MTVLPPLRRLLSRLRKNLVPLALLLIAFLTGFFGYVLYPRRAQVHVPGQIEIRVSSDINTLDFEVDPPDHANGPFYVHVKLDSTLPIPHPAQKVSGYENADLAVLISDPDAQITCTSEDPCLNKQDGNGYA